MRKEIGILLAWVVFLSGCVGKPMEKQNEQTKKEDAVLRLYTLKENENLWQSAKLFMEKYPKYPVVIEVGISEEDGKTVSDAIRSLNTEIMAGNGPDIILMDGLPIEDYIEKGGLEDLSDMVESVKENGEEFFENVLSSYEKGEKVYAIPSRFSVSDYYWKRRCGDTRGSKNSIRHIENTDGRADKRDRTECNEEYSVTSIDFLERILFQKRVW